MNTYEDSNGFRYRKSEIDRKIRKAKIDFLETKKDEGALFCERTGKTFARLHVSHIISVKWAQENGKVELCWDPENFELLSQKAHEEIESLKNWKRVEYYHARKKGIKFKEYIKKT